MQHINLTEASPLDWNEIERHFRADNATSAVYPLFEGAIWEMGVAHSVIAALDEHRAALEWALCSNDQSARPKLRRAQIALEDARSQFLCTSHAQGGSSDDASQTLRDLEMAWQSRLLHDHPLKP